MLEMLGEDVLGKLFVLLCVSDSHSRLSSKLMHASTLPNCEIDLFTNLKHHERISCVAPSNYVFVRRVLEHLVQLAHLP